MARFLDRLGRTAARHKWIMIGIWVLIAVVVGGWAQIVGGKTTDVYTIPGAQSQKAQDLLEERFPAQAGGTASVVFRATSGTLSDPAAQAAIAQTEANLAPGNAPARDAGPRADHTRRRPRVRVEERDDRLRTRPVRRQGHQPAPETVKQLEAAAAPAEQAGLHVEFGGPVVDYLSRDEGGDADVIGLFFAVIILLIAFGSVVAMSVPIGTALFGLAISLSIISLIAAVTDIGTSRRHSRR